MGSTDILAVMSRGSSVRLRAALVALLAVICTLLATVDEGADAQTTTDPLTITIDSMTPTTSSGDIHLSGSITNTDVQTWRAINILPCLALTPILSVSDLATATRTANNALVCNRITQVSTVIDELDPGVTATWSLTVPSSLLPHLRGGVYWFGVHALGTSSAGISANADGRARTFLPVVAPTTKPARVHVIVEITEQIGYDPTGRLMEATSLAPGAPTWASEFSGHLNRLLSVVAHTRGADVMIDPAVVDAAIHLADGNAGWLGDAGALSDTKSAAQAWLASFKYVAKAHHVWALPYGDVDVTATADRPDIVLAAEAAALAPFRAIGVHAAAVRRSPDLSASQAVVNGSQESTAFVDGQVIGSLATAEGVSVVGTALASFGAPAPGDPYASVPLRQQILAEAALRVGSTSPVVVVIPSAFSPTDPTGFAEGLAAPWVSLSTLPEALAGLTPTQYPTQPRAVAESPLVHASVDAYYAAIRTAGTLHTMTGLDVTGTVTKSALTAMSRDSIHGPAAQDIDVNVGALLGSVAVTAPPGVTLSGSSGRFSISLENKLSVPVTVGLRADADQETSIGRFGTLTLPAHGSGTMLANVSVNAHGNHRVLFSVTDATGRATGVTVEVAVRSVQVSGVIWAFIVGGVGLLGAAIAMRLVRRIRSRP